MTRRWSAALYAIGSVLCGVTIASAQGAPQAPRTPGQPVVSVYSNTFLSEVHQMGPASNLHFRNNLVLAQGAWPEVFSIETFTPWSTSDYNGLSASAAISMRPANR